MNRIYISVSDLIEVLTRRNPYRYLWNREEHCQDTRYSALLDHLHVQLRNSLWYLSELRLRCYRAIVLAYIRIAIELEMRTPFSYHWQEPAQPSVLIARSISRVENNVISTNCDGGNLMQDAEQTVWSPLTAQTAFSTTSSREIRNQVTVGIQLSCGAYPKEHRINRILRQPAVHQVHKTTGPEGIEDGISKHLAYLNHRGTVQNLQWSCFVSYRARRPATWGGSTNSIMLS